MTKTQLRQKAAAASKLSAEEYDHKSNAITELAVTINEVSEARSVFIYLSTATEPNTERLIERFITEGKKVYVPVVAGDDMYLTEYSGKEKLKIGRFGIKEPINAAVADIIPDVALVPMVAFDSRKTRLGHGKGYYDNYLLDKPIFKVGLCFSELEFDYIPRDAHDVAMDIIVTDKRIII